ncbi:PREDICTED: kelch-like protein 12 isoform X1 [Rhinopithecus bieti]|uniref:kelch-like protein 12 isoform X1 n=1 Tax=Rhinopithecus bieti TaxID=61621 RepID=UPI00083C4508|nr:PREDICTED: kelch-like protein 12 isoform X1 [Rhinopithecus bieti]
MDVKKFEASVGFLDVKKFLSTWKKRGFAVFPRRVWNSGAQQRAEARHQRTGRSRDTTSSRDADSSGRRAVLQVPCVITSRGRRDQTWTAPEPPGRGGGGGGGSSALPEPPAGPAPHSIPTGWGRARRCCVGSGAELQNPRTRFVFSPHCFMGGIMAPKDIMTNTHAKSILNSMNSLRKSNTLCDVTLRVEQKDFPAHRIVLAACSDYFCAMFTSELSEKGKPYVDIQGLTASTMEILLDFVYTETVHVTVENVQELLPAACLLQLKGVKQACCEFLESQLDPSNCLGIRDFAETHNCVDLMQAAEVFSQKHFPEVVQHEEFILLSQGEVEKLIKCDEIQVDSEEPVFEAVINWVKHAKKEREESLPNLLQYVRMPLLTPRYITDVIDAEPFIRCSLQCRDLVDEAKKFHLRPELRSQMQGPRTRARLGANEVLLVVGGFGSQQSPIDVVEKYDPKTQEWSFLPSITRKRRYVASVSLHDRIYVIGGYDGRSRLSSVECLDYTADEDGVWYSVAPMNVRRGLAGATTLGDMIYVSGGFDGSRRHTSMERYDPNIDQWSMLGDMQTAREGAGLVVASGVIYCLGGYDGLNILNSVEKYDPHTGHWTNVTPMATKRSGAGVALLNDHIYVVGGFDGTAHLSSVEAYNIRTDSWTTVTSMTTPRCYVGATVLRGRLYAIAGYDGNSLLSSIECYDPIIDSWEVVTSMGTQRCDAGVCVLREK